MPEKVTYYAIVNEFSSREHPGGVIRRIVDDEGRDDQAFTRDLTWEHTGTLYSYERGNMDNKALRDHRGRGEPDRGAHPPHRNRRRLTPP